MAADSVAQLVTIDELIDTDDVSKIIQEWIKLKENEMILFDLVFPIERINHYRNPNYYELTIERFTPNIFKRHFRFSRSSVAAITDILVDKNVFGNTRHGGRQRIFPEKQVCIFLWYMATTETTRSIADRSDVTDSSVNRIVKRVSSGMNDMRNEFFVWPIGNSLKQTLNDFKGKLMDGCIGAIDVSHIHIKKPEFCGENYINRKQYPSIILQGVVNSRIEFIDCNVGWPGSVHDARVFSRSEIGIIMMNSPMETSESNL